MPTQIIYIPGLGDGYDPFRAAALKCWRLWGVTATHVPIVWYDGGDLNSKMSKIKSVIDRVPAGARVVIVGESAGATLALHAAATDSRVARVVTLCGVARPDMPISRSLRARAPALDQAVATLPASLRADVHSIRAAVDGVVAKRYSTVSGATSHVIWSVGHLFTIVLCLTVLAPIVSTIAKRQKT